MITHSVRIPASGVLRFPEVALLTLLLSAWAALAHAAAPELYDISVVEFAGRAGHEAFFPMQGLPVQGSSAVVRARLIGAASNVQLLILDSAGNTLAQIPMLVPAKNQTVAGTFFADITVPTVPFSFSVTGTDSSGNPFTVSPTPPQIISPPTMSVTLIPTTSDLSVGLPAYFYARITNSGVADTFSVSLTTSSPSTVNPVIQSVSLKTGETALVYFLVTPSTDSSRALLVNIHANAVSATNKNNSNPAVLVLPKALIPGRELIAWRADDRRSGEIMVLACDTEIELQTMSLASELAPETNGLTVMQSVSEALKSGKIDTATADAWHSHCDNLPLLRLIFDAKDIDFAASRGIRKDTREMPVYLPLTAFSADGAKLLAYLPFRADELRGSGWTK
jgi:hypothetical protein